MKESSLFNDIVHEYSSSIFSIAYRYTNDYSESEDLTQDVFLKIYNNINKFNKDSKLSTWIYRIAINTCIDWCRKNKRIDYIDSANLITEKSSFNTEEKVIMDEQQNMLHHIVYSLPEIYKTVIVLYHFNNLSYKEISSILNISEKTIETRLYRARRKIKDTLTLYENGGEINAL